MPRRSFTDQIFETLSFPFATPARAVIALPFLLLLPHMIYFAVDVKWLGMRAAIHNFLRLA